MFKTFHVTLGITLLSHFISGSAMADSMATFDFDALSGKVYKAKSAKSVEAYMESIYGEDISVSNGTVAVKGYVTPPTDLPFNLIGKPTAGGMYLRSSRKAPMVLDFGEHGISSFSLDWKLFKNSKGLTIFADGIAVDQHSLTKADKKKGATGNLTLYFDTSVHKLEFLGAKGSRFGVDNLIINLPDPDDGSGGTVPTIIDPYEENEENGTGGTNLPPENIIINTSSAVPEPASFVLLALGLFSAGVLHRLARRES